LGVTEPNWFLTNAAFLCGFFLFGQEPKQKGIEGADKIP